MGFSDAASDLASKTIRLLNTSLAKDGSLNASTTILIR